VLAAGYLAQPRDHGIPLSAESAKSLRLPVPNGHASESLIADKGNKQRMLFLVPETQADIRA